MNRIPRYRGKGYGLMFPLFAVFMMVLAASKMLPLDLGDGPLYSKIFVVAFIFCWYGLLAVYALHGLSWLQTLEIDREEIRVCLGRFIVRRIPIRQIRSVGMSVQYGKHHISIWELVLSEEDRHTLNQRGEKYLKRWSVRKWMKAAGVSAEGRDAAARACLFQSRKGILLRAEWTEEAEAILRRYLPDSAFIL